MTTDLIHAFRQMHMDERQQALDALTAELTPYEWRALHATTSTRTFQYDVIGKLPVELVAHIFAFLDVAAPYRLQSVSTRWNNTLRSLHILKAGLTQWYQGTVNLRDADYALCKKKARAIHAFRTGKPRTVYKITPKNDIYNLLFMGNSLIWEQPFFSTRGSRSACVLDLATWHLRILCGDAREQLLSVVASHEIVVLTTWTNICYVHELHGKRGCKKFRLPHSKYCRNVACRGRTVASVASFQHYTSVFIWEYDLQRARSFEIKHDPGTIFFESAPSKLQTLAPLIQPATQTIVIFNNAARATEPPHRQDHFAFSRYTYSGECISTHYPSLPGLSTIIPWSDANRFVPVDDTETVVAIRMSEQSQANSSFLLRFNQGENDVRVWKDSKAVREDGSWYANGSIASWKDTYYGTVWDEYAEQRDVIAYLGTSDARCYMPIVSESRDMSMAHTSKKANEPILVNEKYLVHNAVDRFYLLCFDDDGQGEWPKNSESFFDMGELELLQTRDS